MMSLVLFLLVCNVIDPGLTRHLAPDDVHLQPNAGLSEDSAVRLERAINMSKRDIIEEKEPAEDFDIEEEDFHTQEPEFDLEGTPQLVAVHAKGRGMDTLDHTPEIAKIHFKVPHFFTQTKSHTTNTFTLGITYDKDVQHIDYFEVIVLQLELDNNEIPRLIDTDTRDFKSFISYTQRPHDGIPYIAARFRAEDFPGEITIGDGLHYAGFINGVLNPGSYYALFIRGIREGLDGHAEHESSEYFSDVNSPDKPAYFMTRPPANKLILLLPVALGSVILLLSILFMYFVYMVKLRKVPEDIDLERSLSGMDCGYHKVPTKDNEKKIKKFKLKRPMTKKEKSQKMDYEKLMRKHRIMEETIKEHLESLEVEKTKDNKHMTKDEICVADLVRCLSFETSKSGIEIHEVKSDPKSADRGLHPVKVMAADVTVHHTRAPKGVTPSASVDSFIKPSLSKMSQNGLTKSEEDVYAAYLKEQARAKAKAGVKESSTDLTDFSLYPTDDEDAPPKKRVIRKPVHKSRKTKTKSQRNRKPTPIEVVTDGEGSDFGDDNPPPAKKQYEPVKQEEKALLKKQPKELKEAFLKENFRRSLYAKNEKKRRAKARQEFESRRKSID